MYTRILVAVDDSDISKLAMQEATKLAQDQQAKLCIVYVVDEFIQAGEGIPVDFKKHEASVRKYGLSVLNEMVALAQKEKVDAEGHLIELVESNDPIAEKIVAEAEKWRADLIVIGTHGRTGLTRLILGSVAEEVIRNATVPVHVVRGQE